MVSITEVDGDKPNRQAAWKNKPKSKNKNLNFTGATKSDSVLFQKITTSKTSQTGQIITIVEYLPSYIGNKGYAEWAESICLMERKIQDDFILAIVNRRAYGTVITSVFTWNGNALDTEDEYNRDVKIWEISATVGIKQ